MKFKSQHPPYEYLHKKWLGKHKAQSEEFLSSHASQIRQLTLGGLGGLMLLTTPAAQAYTYLHPQSLGQSIAKVEDKNALLAKALQGLVPDGVRKLTDEEEAKIIKVLSDNLGLLVRAELAGIRLNRSYGLIGGEQHLYRYPGDNLYQHFDNVSEWAMYGPAEIAPSLGAWGYFAPSKHQFTLLDKEREKFYLAVPTFLAPGFAENFAKYRDFFKFRKMLVVNPQTGQAVVAVVGDAGPAEWTGKHLGGSPEVMQYLGLTKGPRRGPVLYFFIDDPTNAVSLGPVMIK